MEGPVEVAAAVRATALSGDMGTVGAGPGESSLAREVASANEAGLANVSTGGSLGLVMTGLRLAAEKQTTSVQSPLKRTVLEPIRCPWTEQREWSRARGYEMERERTIKYTALEEEGASQSNYRNCGGSVEEGNLVVDSARLGATGGRRGRLEGRRRTRGRVRRHCKLSDVRKARSV